MQRIDGIVTSNPQINVQNIELREYYLILFTSSATDVASIANIIGGTKISEIPYTFISSSVPYATTGLVIQTTATSLTISVQGRTASITVYKLFQ